MCQLVLLAQVRCKIASHQRGAGRREEMPRVRVLTAKVAEGSIRKPYAQNLAMPKISVYIPDDLVERIKKEQPKYQSFSSFCCSIIEEGLNAEQEKLELLETLKRQRQAHG